MASYEIGGTNTYVRLSLATEVLGGYDFDGYDGDEFDGYDGGGLVVRREGFEFIGDSQAIASELIELTTKAADEARRDPQTAVFLYDFPGTVIGDADDSDLEEWEDNGYWGLDAIRPGKRAHDLGERATIGIVDSGIDQDHSAFGKLRSRSGLIAKGFGSDASTNDATGHGTHCAGLAFGDEAGGQRIGVAPHVRTAFVAKVVEGVREFHAGALVEAIQWLHSQECDVISLSLGWDLHAFREQLVDQGMNRTQADSKTQHEFYEVVKGFDVSLQAIRANEDGGPLVFAASGNESDRYSNDPYTVRQAPPAASPHAVGVGASEATPSGCRVAGFSNTYPQFAAPGVRIRSAWPGGTTRVQSGTSSSTPIAAGVAAVWIDHLKRMRKPADAATVISRMQETARLFGARRESDMGYGQVSEPVRQ